MIGRIGFNMGYKDIGNGIEYDDLTHRYRHANVERISVTTVLNHRYPIPKFKLNDPDFQYAMRHGTEVHEATELIDEGGGITTEFRERIKTELVMEHAGIWSVWRNENVEKILSVEFGVVSVKYGYCGRIDRIVKLKDGRVVVIDIKTGAASTNGRLQVAAYVEACREMGIEIDGGMIVSLKGGVAKVSEVNMLKHFGMFIERLDELNKDNAYDTHMEA